MLISKEVEVGLKGKNIKYYEDLKCSQFNKNIDYGELRKINKLNVKEVV